MLKTCWIAGLALLLAGGCSAAKEEAMPDEAIPGRNKGLPTTQPTSAPSPTDNEAVRQVPAAAQAVHDKGDTTQPWLAPLSEEEKRVILEKGTEEPFTGKYYQFFEPGVYACRQCGALLYLSDSKFRADCGWPSFDDEVPGAVKHQADVDGLRTEILCANCGAHLGHVFYGEGYTENNTRHCVNSISLVFIPESRWPLKRAIFAGGCFWGVEHDFERVPAVLSVKSGYTGGTTANPTYEQVCTGRTGHAESVQVLYDPRKVSYEQLARLFFEMHDPTQRSGQGPDVGSQYRSAVFYFDEEQKRVAENLIAILRDRGYDVVTQVQPASKFYPAEEYHQDYMRKHPDTPDCHVRVNRFGLPLDNWPAAAQ